MKKISLTAALLALAGCAQGAPEATGSHDAATETIGVVGSSITQDAVVPAIADTYVKELASTKSFGTETSLRVQGLDRQRGIVRFDQAQLAAAANGRAVEAAELELSVQDVGWIWGQVAAHRLEQTSTETGATWRCANDTNTGNSLNNCTSANNWNMGAWLPSGLPFESSASDVQSISNSTSVVRLDVTSDVRAFLNGTKANHGWLLKVVIEGVPGTVRFKTRESGVAPKLILDLAPPACTPSASTDTTCDGVDDDCSGTADEDYASTATSCGVGACAASGATSCVNGSVVDSCVAGAPAANDASCDSIDNDCNGVVDDGYVAVATSCGVGACAAAGATSCVAGTIVDSCVAGAPAANDASCDGIDNDCNGATDEAYASVATSCGIGACAATGSTSCVAGSVVDSCAPSAPAATDATCDAVDDDCDGFLNEDYASVSTSCGSGACATGGFTLCSSGIVVDTCTVSCEGACTDALDDDNDGQTDCADSDCASAPECNLPTVGDPCESDDECQGYSAQSFCISEEMAGFVGGYCSATCADNSECPAGSECLGGACGIPCSNTVTCDGIGFTCLPLDQDGNGVCLPTCTSDSDCSGGRICGPNGFCEPDFCEPTGADDTCDNNDDDCDGLVDESYASQPTTCGIPTCGGSGELTCVNGAVVDTCEVPTDCPSANVGDSCESDADCAGLPQPYCATEESSGLPGGYCSSLCSDDSECPGGAVCIGSCVIPCMDGTCDDGLACYPVPETPGGCIPVCDDNSDCTGGRVCDVASGTCIDYVDPNCTPTSPSDDTCNNVDDDCDGQLDEDFGVRQISCGSGACTGNGTLTCTDGVMVESCSVPTGCEYYDIDTTYAWDFQQTIGSLCSTGAFGQTFTLSAPSTVNSVSYFIRTTEPQLDFEGNVQQIWDPVSYRVQLVQWDPSTQSAVGPAIVSSGPFTTTDTLTQWNIGFGIALPAGTYAVVFNSAGLGNSSNAAASMGVVYEGGNVYTGGTMIDSQCTDQTEPSNYPWYIDSFQDLAITISVVQDPTEPPPSGTGLVGDPCTSAADCSAGMGCETGFPGGYCFIACDFSQPAGEECPAGSACWLDSTCVVPCNAADSCDNPDFVCDGLDDVGGPAEPLCRPTCIESCVNGNACNPITNLCL